MKNSVMKENNDIELIPNEFNKNYTVDPTKYRILKERRIKEYIIIKLAYIIDLDNQNTKILLFKNCTLLDIVQQENGIHPEFYEDLKIINPVAIFKPDDEGWQMAEFVADNFK